MFPIIGEVVIRTNGGSLVVKAENEDIVKHYGIADDVTIEKVAMASYHEFGQVPFVAIKEGHIELEAGSYVEALHFVKNDSNKFNDMKVSYDSSVTLPEFSRDGGIDIGDGVLVVEVKESNQDSDYIWLKQLGIYEQIEVSDNKAGTEGVQFADSTGNAKLEKIANEIANNYNGKSAGEYTLTNEQINETTRELTTEAANNVTDGGKKAEVVKNSTAAIILGSGIVNDPFIIKDARTYVKWIRMVEEGICCDDKVTYVKFLGTVDLQDVDFTTLPAYVVKNVEYDGNNATVINATSSKDGTGLSSLLGNGICGKYNKVYNLTVKDSYLRRGLFNYSDKDNIGIELTNITMDNCETTHGTLITQFGDGTTTKNTVTNNVITESANTLTIKNCNVKNTYVSGDNNWSSGGFIGTLYQADKILVKIDNCSFHGTLNVGVAGQRCATLVGGNGSTKQNTIVTNTEVKDGTVIRLNSDTAGSGFYAFVAENGSNSDYCTNTGNKFNATVTVKSSFNPGTNAGNIKGQGFFTGKYEGNETKVLSLTATGNNNVVNTVFYTELDSSSFNVTNEGTIKVNYTGSAEKKIMVEVKIGNHSHYYSNGTAIPNDGGYPVVLGTVTKIVSASSQTIDTEVLSFTQHTNDSSKDYNGKRTLIEGGVLYFDSSIDSENKFYKLEDNATVTVTISEVDDNGHVIDYCTKNIPVTKK